jgi:uncharacterized protein YqjF (DUF2071 family)
MIRRIDASGELSLSAPRQVGRAVMIQRWERLTFLHWPYAVGDVSRLLPADLEPDVFDDRAWVAILPFRLTVRLPGLPVVPWMSRFDEVNVRTYVRGPDGGRGIWFLSLDASRLAAVAVARHSYRIPYMWSRTAVTERGSIVRSRVSRLWPGPAAGLDVTVERGQRIDEPTELERFLVCRWRLYSPSAMRLPMDRIRLAVADVDHPPWRLHRARVEHLDEGLLETAGLPTPPGEPLAHYSPGVPVRFGPRVPVGVGT